MRVGVDGGRCLGTFRHTLGVSQGVVYNMLTRKRVVRPLVCGFVSWSLVQSGVGVLVLERVSYVDWQPALQPCTAAVHAWSLLWCWWCKL